MVNIAIETLARRLDAPLGDIQWVATAYLLALALVIPISGWASERVGAKRLWLLATALFVVGSALASTAWSLESLIASRVLQGIGGGLIIPIGHSIAVSQAGDRSMTRVIGALNAPILAAPMFGPAVGGVLLTAFGWRSIFLLNVPLGLIAIALGVRVLPPSPADRSATLDPRGVLLLCPGVVLVLLGAVRLGHPGALVLFVAGMVLLGAFTAHAAHRGASAVVRVSLFRGRTFSLAAIVTFVGYVIHVGTLAVLPLYFLVVRGVSPLAAGLLVGIQGVGSLIGLTAVGRLSDRLGPVRLAQCGLALATLATVPLVFVTDATPYTVLSVVLLARGAGLSLTLTPLYATAYAAVAAEDVPHATTILNTVARLGASFGVALLLLLTQHQIADVGTGSALAGEMGTTFALIAAGTVLALGLALLIADRRPGSNDRLLGEHAILLDG